MMKLTRTTGGRIENGWPEPTAAVDPLSEWLCEPPDPVLPATSWV